MSETQRSSAAEAYEMQQSADWWGLTNQERAAQLRKDAAVSRKRGHHLDAAAYASAAEAYEDEIAGIRRCTCGRVLKRGRGE
jgi:hypothetical protein